MAKLTKKVIRKKHNKELNTNLRRTLKEYPDYLITFSHWVESDIVEEGFVAHEEVKHLKVDHVGKRILIS